MTKIDENQTVTELHIKIDYLEKIISLMPGHVYWLDKNNVYQGCNDVQAKSVELKSRHDIIGKRNRDLIWKEFADDLDNLNLEVMKTGKTHIEEENIRTVNGVKIVLSQKVPLYDNNNNVMGILGISFDITERKRMEKELREAKEKAEIVNQVKTDFIRNMEHDIRTPISGLIGVTNYLKAQQSNHRHRELLEDMELASCELRDYLNGILEFSQTMTNTGPPIEKEVDIRNIITSVLNLQMPTIKDKNLELVTKYAKDVPQIVIGDTFRLHRILLNLVSNAIKFTNQGKVIIKTSIKSKDSDTLDLQISISDTGIGIAKQHQSIIYDKFTRCMPANQGTYKGTGLGLWIVKQFLDEMGGHISLKSNVGKGSVFQITLPVRISDSK
jgi:two-component system aerobic respiration control sensor histidine kinase ArcB